MSPRHLAFPLLALLLAGCTGDTGPRRLTLANVHVEGYPTARGIEVFAEAVAAAPELAGYTVDLQLGGVLGNEKETLEKLGFGGVQLACTSVAPLAEFSETIGVLTLPYLFRDPDHLWTVLDGPLGDELLATLEPDGFVGLAFYDAGARSFYNRERPIHTLDDLQGLKIRVQKSEIMREMVAALGASPVSLGFKEVYTNLYTGSIDGAENNLPSYRSERHFEVARYYSYDRHSTIPDVLLVRRELFEQLTQIEQTGLRNAAKRSAAAQREFFAETVQEALEEVRAAGSEVNEIDDPEAFQRAVEPLYERYAGRYGDWVKRIRAAGPGSPASAPDAPPGNPPNGDE
jgi:tripartite ATP-independent transporter DctP family solute receptor